MDSADVDDEGEEAEMRKGEDIRDDSEEAVAIESVIVFSFDSRQAQNQRTRESSDEKYAAAAEEVACKESQQHLQEEYCDVRQ